MGSVFLVLSVCFVSPSFSPKTSPNVVVSHIRVWTSDITYCQHVQETFVNRQPTSSFGGQHVHPMSVFILHLDVYQGVLLVTCDYLMRGSNCIVDADKSRSTFTCNSELILGVDVLEEVRDRNTYTFVFVLSSETSVEYVTWECSFVYCDDAVVVDVVCHGYLIITIQRYG